MDLLRRSRHIPSVKMLRDRLTTALEGRMEDANMLRHLLVDWKNRDIKSSEMMEEANGLLRGHGVEHIESEDGRASAYYVNMGDTYETTIVLDTQRDRVWVTSWGAWLEAEERAGHTFS